MREVSSIPALRGARSNAVAVGAFDGLHRGHLAVIGRMVRDARRRSGRAVVVTFETPPRLVLDPRTAPGLLISPEDKRARLRALGVDLVVHLSLTPALRRVRAEDFVKAYLLRLRPASVFCGPSIRFGHNREGNGALLRRLGGELGFAVRRVPAVRDGRGRVVSSSAIRERLAAGDLAAASSMLGRPYAASGTVVRGLGVASACVGVPTANLDTGRQMLPPPGVYAVFVKAGKAVCGGALNVGRETPPKVEVHLIGVSPGPLYGRTLAVGFIRRIRGEIVFRSLEEERKTIRRDILRIRRVLDSQAPAEGFPPQG